MARSKLPRKPKKPKKSASVATKRNYLERVKEHQKKVREFHAQKAEAKRLDKQIYG